MPCCLWHEGWKLHTPHLCANFLQPGTVVGEGAFFSGEPRSATISSCANGIAWSLSWEQFEAMSAQYPKLALDLTKGLAAVLAVRMREAILVGQFV